MPKAKKAVLPPTKVPVQVLLDPDVADGLRDMADQNERSLSGQCRVILNEAVR